MQLTYLAESKDLITVFNQAEKGLLFSKKIKFEKTKLWRNTFIPDHPGVYALFEGKEGLLYIGETGNLKERMSDICRTVNHTFRKQLGHKRYGAIKSRKKFDSDIEALLDIFFNESLHVAFIEVNYGRVEIETHLVTKYQSALLNSVKKRKIKQQLDELISQ